MSSYHLELTSLANPKQIGVRWCLDFPLPEQRFELDEKSSTLYLQGWLVQLAAVARVRIFVRQGEETLFSSLNCQRPDVISAILNEAPEQHRQLRCGFKLDVKVVSEQLILGVELDGQATELMRIQVRGVFKVLRGEQQWLFLDNDTNKSVEQYTGKLLLGASRLQRWQSYLTGLKQLELQHKIPTRLLIAPSKEMVYPQYYPHQRAELTPIGQLCQLAETCDLVVYPEQALQQMSERSFRLSDTHWSAPGAREAAIQLALALGLDEAAIRQKFSKDSYRTARRYGDLGKKVFPPLAGEEQVLKSFNHRRLVRYDNRLPNFGRVVITTNRLAVVNATVLMFGSSSSYSMLDYLSRIFRQLILVHSAGNVDQELVRQLQPDYLVTQTNARFVVIPPVIKASLREIMRDKLAKLPRAEQQHLLEKAALMQQKSRISVVNTLHQLFAEEVAVGAG